jgi:hypothetical protein
MPSRSDFDASEIERISECPLCVSPDARELFVEKGFLYVECDSCDLIFSRERVREEFLDRISADETYCSEVNAAYQQRVGEERLNLIENLRSGPPAPSVATFVGFWAPRRKTADHEKRQASGLECFEPRGLSPIAD